MPLWNDYKLALCFFVEKSVIVFAMVELYPYTSYITNGENKMNIEQAIELIQELQGKDGSKFEYDLLSMAEAALVDLVNYWGDGPQSFNTEIMITEKTK